MINPIPIIIMSLLVILTFLFVFFEKFRARIVIAALMSSTWVAASGLYNYKSYNIYVGLLNIFPLVAWTAGLVGFKMVYDWFDDSVKSPTQLYILLVGTWIILISVIEWVGYNYLEIQLANGDSGFLGYSLMHMPWWGVVYYLSAGMIYLLLTNFLEVD
jgi:hypothetical protein